MKPKILIIYTGGTIGMIENQQTGALEPFDFDHLIDNVPKRHTLTLKHSAHPYVTSAKRVDIHIGALRLRFPCCQSVGGSLVVIGPTGPVAPGSKVG